MRRLKIYNLEKGFTVYLLCKQKKLNVVLYGLFTNILTLLYSPWSLYCLIRFFDSDNHTKNHAGFLYAGMLYLMIESIFIHTIILCILILITVFSIILFFVIRRRRAMEEEQLQRNLQISRLIQRIDLLNITGRRFQLDDICCICMEQFNSSVEVIKLPCDRRHFFHKSCILEWIERSPTCPICKTEISEEMLNNIGISEKSSSKKHSDHEYGGTGNEERKSVHSRATSSSADQIKEKKSESNKKKL